MILRLVGDATAAGASLERACELLGLDCRTVQRWRRVGGGEDRRRGPRTPPSSKITAEEDERLLAHANSPEFRDQSPRQIIPRLADRGVYIASESHLYLLLRRRGLQVHRARSRPPRGRPRSLTATGPNQVYSWDITYLRSVVRGVYFYLYMVVDIWSRRIVAWEVHDRECGQIAAAMVERICQDNPRSGKLVWLHPDNGAPMKSAALLATLHRLDIRASFSRPSVSNDNPYSEALFRTLKYRPNFPSRPYDDIHTAIAWVDQFACWYNSQHLHSAIHFVTPDDRHLGRHHDILARRRRVYAAARRRHPERWSGDIRSWEPDRVVCLNPERRDDSKAKHA